MWTIKPLPLFMDTCIKTFVNTIFQNCRFNKSFHTYCLFCIVLYLVFSTIAKQTPKCFSSYNTEMNACHHKLYFVLNRHLEFAANDVILNL